MDIKKAYSLTFSPTGGTKKIAEHIASAVCERSEFLDVTVKAQDTDFGAEDFVVIVVPVFGGRVPSPVAERLSHVSAQNTPAAIVAVFGNRAYEDALLELRGMAEARGFKVMAAGAFIQGSSIELSADAPMRPPYTVYLQGGLTYESGKTGILLAAQELLRE